MEPLVRSRREALAVGVAGAAAFAAVGVGVTLAATKPARDPAAMRAAQRMGAFLAGLRSFEVAADVTVGATAHGRRQTVAAHGLYRVRRPDAFVVDMADDRRERRFVYDGTSFTVAAPRTCYFATVSAPDSINRTLEVIYADYGVALPLADLLYWGGGAAPTDLVRVARALGSQAVKGAAADHYAFGAPRLNWELWIARGAEPLPLKMVIDTPDDPSKASYTAILRWNLHPAFTADTFAFQPAENARPIALARTGP